MESEGQAGLWNEAYRRGEFRWDDPDQSLGSFLKRLPTEDGQRILDLGSGRGRHMIQIQGLGLRAFGLDFSFVALAGAQAALRSRGLPSRLVNADMRAIPFPAGSFGGIVSYFVIHHGTWDRVLTALMEVSRILGPGGQALITFISDQHSRYGEGERIEEKTYKLARGADAGIPHRFFSEEEVREIAGLAELAVAEILPLEAVDPEGDRHAQWLAFLERPL